MPAVVRVVASGECFSLADVSLIGRGEGVAIRLTDPSVSRQHAAIRFEESRYWVADLGSANGTFVNGAALTSSRALRHGDKLQFGKLMLVFEESGLGVSEVQVLSDKTQISRPFTEAPRSAPTTILVADLKGFTALSAQLTAADVAGLLREWYADCGAVLKRHGASIDSFIGDCVFAYWHSIDPGTRIKALATARMLQAGVPSMASPLRAALEKERGFRLECRVGIHVGQVAVGSMGKGINTALGSAVNLAFRIESLTRVVGRPILVSREFVADFIGAEGLFETCGHHPIKGLLEPVEVFAPIEGAGPRQL
jgi:adenylate cyclase